MISENIVVRRCRGFEEFQACVKLQRDIWGESDLEVEPVTIFVVAANTGGQVLGAFDGERLAGFTLAVAGWRDNRPYLHSHMTGVDARCRNRGVGRMLKLFQRDDALGRGIRLIEWTFDPLEMRNAYFNLNRLGAIARRYLPNLYGVTTSPLHRGLETDRLVAEWHLDSPRVIAAIENTSPPLDAPVRIEVPPASEPERAPSLENVRAVQSRVRNEFQNWFARAYAALGTRSVANRGSAYLLAPWSDF